ELAVTRASGDERVAFLVRLVHDSVAAVGRAAMVATVFFVVVRIVALLRALHDTVTAYGVVAIQAFERFAVVTDVALFALGHDPVAAPGDGAVRVAAVTVGHVFVVARFAGLQRAVAAAAAGDRGF